MTRRLSFDQLVSVAVAASILLLVGSLGPWVTVLTSSTGFGADRILTGGLAVLAGIAAGTVRARPSAPPLRAPWIGALAGLLATLTTAYDALSAATASVTVGGATVESNVAWGLWIALLSAPVLMISMAALAGRVRQLS